MTTPNQPKPDWGPQFADLSYEIGGGAYNYGQDMTDDIARWLIYGEFPTPDNMWDMLETNLLRVPLEVLQHWCPFIPGKTIEDDFDTVEKAVRTILDYFPTIPKLLKIETWEQWLSDVFGPFYDDVNQFLTDALAWLNDTFNPFFDEVNKFIQDTLAWLEDVFKPLEGLVHEIENLANEAWDIASKAWDWVQQVIDALMQGFHGWSTAVAGFNPSDLRDVGRDIGIAIGELNHVALRVQQLEQGAAKALENFSTYAQNALGLPTALWNQFYAGTGSALLGTQSGYAVLTPTPDTINRIAVASTKVVTDGDIQAVTAVISKPLTDAGVSANTILARVDVTNPLQNNVYAKLTDTTAEIGFVKAGVTTVLSKVNNPLKNGAAYTLQAGIGAATNTFQLLENSRPVFTTPPVDALGQSAIGAQFRSAGFGVIAPNPTARPGVVAAFSVFNKL